MNRVLRSFCLSTELLPLERVVAVVVVCDYTWAVEKM